MARLSDIDRIIWLLSEEGGTSNQQVKASLALDDSRSKTIIDELKSEGLVEKYRCRGGGIRLTSKGLKQKPLAQAESTVDKEIDLYLPFQNALISEAQENEENAIVLDTSSFRMRGKWSNPDITKISVQRYPIQRLHKVVLITY